MKQHSDQQCSALRKTVIVRMGKYHCDILTKHLKQDPHKEQFAFLLASRIDGPEKTILVVRDMLLPDRGDLSEQSAGGVAPTAAFQRTVYAMAEAVGLSIIDVHTHPHQGKPRFSWIDTSVATANGRYIDTHFEDERVTHAMIVFGNDVRQHDAVIYERASKKCSRCTVTGRSDGEPDDGADDAVSPDSRQRTRRGKIAPRRCNRSSHRGEAGGHCGRRGHHGTCGGREGGRGGGGYRVIDRLEILGRGMESRETRPAKGRGDTSDRFARQLLVPGWRQELLAKQRIVVVGAGGNGAPLLQSLLSLGVGAEGWLAVVDPDVIEASNLPRIPYAMGDADVGEASGDGDGADKSANELVGVAKVEAAARYGHLRAPGTRVLTYATEAATEEVVARIREATLLIGAADNDGVREFLNECSVRYLIPYIDLGCDIQVEKEGWIAGGQVRVVISGETACLLCCDGYDPAQAALDTMDPRRRAEHAAVGYVRGADAEAPTPSVANLNAMTAQLGVAAVLSLVHGPSFGAWDYVHFDPVKGEMVSAKSKPRADCPLCGMHGLLGAGDAGGGEALVADDADGDTASETEMVPWETEVAVHPEADQRAEEERHDDG